jgi:hypothetical protein
MFGKSNLQDSSKKNLGAPRLDVPWEVVGEHLSELQKIIENLNQVV